MLQHDGNGMLLKSDANNLANDCCNDGGGGGGTECTNCEGQSCLDTYYVSINMTSGTCVDACTNYNISQQAFTKVSGKCQWTYENGERGYELTCDADDGQWHGRVWRGGIGTGTLCADWVQVSASTLPCPPIGTDVDGTWVRESGACFGNFGVSCCPSIQAPSIDLAIFDADYAGGSITWCNQTWTPAEIQAGAQKTVCPQAYSNDYSTSFNWGERWRYNGGGSLGSLRLYRGYSLSPRRNYVFFKDSNNTAGFDRIDTLGTTLQLGILTGGTPIPTVNDYQIPSSFFGSFTAPSGVQYSWSQKCGW